MTDDGEREPSEATAKALRAQAPALLGEIVRGFDEADRPREGLGSALVRVVFVLFAEARGLLPASALTALHARLREDARRHGAAMDRRHGAWAEIVGGLRSLGLFAPGAHALVEGRVPDGAVFRVLDGLLGERLVGPGLDVEHLGAVYEGLLAGEHRRRSGAHYTSRAITRIVVERALAPLVHEGTSPDEILALRIRDPAMGSGAFLVEACRQLADRLVQAWTRTSTRPPSSADEAPIFQARRLVARRCLYGVDRDALAVDLARLSLWLVAEARAEPFTFADHALRHGDSLVGLTGEQMAGAGLGPGRLSRDLMLATFFAASDRRARTRAMRSLPELAGRALRGDAGPEVELLLAALRARHLPFHWEIELPEVFGEGRGGFDAMIGNPPWVSYAGRAAQPLAADLRDFYAATSPAFFGYRNLQGVFVHRAASLLRPGGRLGLVLPTSMSDLGGYEPSRRAHDALCACDDELPDFGDRAFDGVFQPSMGLLSTRRPRSIPVEEAAPWPLQRRDLDGETIALLDALGALPRMPPQLFGERGFQSTGEDNARLHDLPAPQGVLTTGVRVGGDVEPFLRRPPQLHCDPRAFGGRFRPEAEWRAVKLLIRQTARYPMAALSDGGAFRNSILAGFSDAEHGEHLLLAYLNSAPIRWFHYMRHRDARQGMPQLKITHLRSLPAPPRGSPALPALERLGRELGGRNTGVSPAEQETIDGLVADALGLDSRARARIATWARSVRG